MRGDPRTSSLLPQRSGGLSRCGCRCGSVQQVGLRAAPGRKRGGTGWERGPYIAPRAAGSAGSCGAGGRAVSLLRTANFSEFSAKWEGRRCPEEGRERGAGAEGAVYGPALCWGPWLPGARPRAQFAVGSAKNAPCQTGGLVRSEGKISKWWRET